MDLVFWLLVCLKFMYFQYNVYLSIVVHTNIIIYTHVILGHPSWWALPTSWGVKNGFHHSKVLANAKIISKNWVPSSSGK